MENMFKIKPSDIQGLGINLFGKFIETSADHDLASDMVKIRLTFFNTVYELSAPFNDFMTEEGATTIWSNLITRCMLNHERGANMVQPSDKQIEDIKNGSTPNS